MLSCLSLLPILRVNSIKHYRLLFINGKSSAGKAREKNKFDKNDKNDKNESQQDDINTAAKSGERPGEQSGFFPIR
jgi:hypothetical protein